MKSVRVLLSFIAIGIALYEQSETKPNLWIVIPAVLVFCFGMMPLFNSPKKEDVSDDE
jgi:hypothetical protein